MPSSRPGGPLPFLDHLAAESARFRSVLAGAPTAARVPSCPDWDADDLLWHLAGVQWFWGEIAERRLTDPDEVEAMDAAREERPSDRDGLLAFFDRSSERLRRVLGELPPETPLWMWSDDKTAGYIRRRQAHEALIHRLDAELTVDERTPLDCRLAADGVDEVLRVMRGYEPEPGLTHTPTGPMPAAPPTSAARPPTSTAGCGTGRPMASSPATGTRRPSPRSTPSSAARSTERRHGPATDQRDS